MLLSASLTNIQEEIVQCDALIFLAVQLLKAMLPALAFGRFPLLPPVHTHGRVRISLFPRPPPIIAIGKCQGVIVRQTTS